MSRCDTNGFLLTKKPLVSQRATVGFEIIFETLCVDLASVASDAGSWRWRTSVAKRAARTARRCGGRARDVGPAADAAVHAGAAVSPQRGAALREGPGDLRGAAHATRPRDKGRIAET